MHFADPDGDDFAKLKVRLYLGLWADLLVLWARTPRTRDAWWWASRLAKMLKEMRAWECDRRSFVAAAGPERVDEMLRDVAARAAVECGPAHRTTDALMAERFALQPVLEAERAAREGWLVRLVRQVDGVLGV